MAEVKPFRAVRYDERRAGPLDRLVAPPYDVISPEQRLEYLARSPYNVVHLTLPDAEEDAARAWSGWQREGVLAREPEPALWWLVQDYVGPDGVARTREGVVVSLRAEPYEAGVVLPHERTHAGPKEGRLRLLRAVRAQLEPIFLLYEGALEGGAAGEPLLEATDGGVTTCLWRIEGGEIVERLAGARLLIADGHHRYETALAFHREDGSPESAYLMAVVVPIDQEGLTIFPTHRVARRAAELDGGFRVTPISGGPGEALRMLEGLTREHPAFVVYRGGAAALVEVLEEQGLDVAALDRLGLEGISYTPQVDEAVAFVDRGEAEAAYLLRPPTIDEVAAVAESGETMPQKSTYFFPKLTSGLLFHPL